MKSLSILVVDDDRDFARGLTLLLQLEGHQVEHAFDGEEAVRTVGEQNFDVVFMDVRLPGMNGVESSREIRKIKPRTKVVMMTAYRVEDLLAQAIDAGALDILNKPFDSENVLRLLEAIKPEGVVLVADDDPEFVRSVEHFLTELGHSVLVAHTGREAVDKALSNGIDVLILDLRLLVLSGLEVYLELKKRDRSVPTIVVTGYAAEEAQSIGSLAELSAAGCLVKPFEPERLIGAVEQLLDEPSAKFA